MIGNCDCCNRENVPVHFVGYPNNSGSDVTACYLCSGDTDPDPYGELDDPEHKVGMAIRAAYAAFDDLMVLANQPETRQLICNEKIALGKLLTRVETLCSFALAVKPAPLLVRNGGLHAAS